MLFIEHFFKWCFAAFLALAGTALLGLTLMAISLFFTDSPAGTSEKSMAASNLRQICQASLIYASDNNNHLPDAIDLPDYARLLALKGGLNEPDVWLGSAARSALPPDFKTILISSPEGAQRLDPRFAELPYLFTVVIGGLNAYHASTTPIAWTRGLDLETGRWRPESPYKVEGGHIVFLGGNVQFFRTLQNAAGGELVSRDGLPTHRIHDALPPGTRISVEPEQPPPTLLERFRRDIPPVIRIAITWAWPLWMLALAIKFTLGIARTWRVPIARVRIEPGPRWLILTPLILLALSVLFRV